MTAAAIPACRKRRFRSLGAATASAAAGSTVQRVVRSAVASLAGRTTAGNPGQSNSLSGASCRACTAGVGRLSGSLAAGAAVRSSACGAGSMAGFGSAQKGTETGAVLRDGASNAAGPGRAEGSKRGSGLRNSATGSGADASGPRAGRAVGGSGGRGGTPPLGSARGATGRGAAIADRTGTGTGKPVGGSNRRPGRRAGERRRSRQRWRLRLERARRVRRRGGGVGEPGRDTVELVAGAAGPQLGRGRIVPAQSRRMPVVARGQSHRAERFAQGHGR